MLKAALFVISQNWKQPRISQLVSECTAVVHPHNGILLGSKKERTIEIWDNMDESQKHYAEWKKPETEGYILPLFLSQFWKGKTKWHKQTDECQGLGEGEGIDYKGVRVNFYLGGRVLYNCGGPYMTVYICQKPLNCTFKIGKFYCLWIITHKGFKILRNIMTGRR